MKRQQAQEEREQREVAKAEQAREKERQRREREKERAQQAKEREKQQREAQKERARRQAEAEERERTRGVVSGGIAKLSQVHARGGICASCPSGSSRTNPASL
jgi:hypothetical protein